MSIKHLTMDQKQQLITEYITGAKIKGLAKKFCVSHWSVWRFLKSSGVNIRPDNHQSNRRYNFDTHVFDVIDTQDKAYWLGFLYADGCNYESRYTVMLSLAEEDAEHVRRFALFLKIDRPIRMVNQRGFGSQRQAGINATDMWFSQRLHQLGMIANKSHVLRFPTSDQVPTHLLRHFVRGYFDGDGSITKTISHSPSNRPSYGISVTSTDQFCATLVDMIRDELSIDCCTTIRFPERNNSTRQIGFNGNLQVASFLDWLYKDATQFLVRKHKRYEELMFVNSIPGKRVQQIDSKGEVLNEYVSAEEAAKAVGGLRISIAAICNGCAGRYNKKGVRIGNRTTYLGFGWRYVNKTWKELLYERT